MDRSILDRRVRELMSSPVRTVEYDVPVPDAARILLHNRIGALVVTESDGILSFR